MRHREGGKEKTPQWDSYWGFLALGCFTHKILIMIISKEMLETAGPVSATLEQAKHTLLTAHVAVPRVLFDGCDGRSVTNEEVNTLHTETPEHRPGRFFYYSEWHIYLFTSLVKISK